MAFKKLTVDGWKPFAFTSRFLNSCEDRYSVNKLELLGIVWSTECFKIYLYRKHFTVITNQKALLSILKENCPNKSYNSRLTPWIDRLLLFESDIEHMSGASMELVDYTSRHSNLKAKEVSAYDEEFFCRKNRSHLRIYEFIN